MKENDPNKNEFLDESIIDKFREVINSSQIFSCHEDYKHKYNLICVFMDRITDTVRYLNANSEMPKTEEDFIGFMVHGSILRDGIYRLFENIFHQKPPYIDEKKFFSDARNYSDQAFTKDTCPTDDGFFEYIRAMAFAHPYEVSGRIWERPFLKNGEKHYCPWVVIGDSVITAFSGLKDAVGVRVYSSIDKENDACIMFSFSSLKEYLKKRYNSIIELKKWAESGIKGQNALWMQKKVNRDQQPEKILKDILVILEERFERSGAVEAALNFLECPLSDTQNAKIVELYRKAIIQAIPLVCDSVDALDYDNIGKALYLLYIRPQKMHKEAHYQLQKIDSYLTVRSEHIDPNSNEFWGLKQAEEFAQKFAKKWVHIDIAHMPYDEIKLLVHTACYMEALEQFNVHKKKRGC